MFSRLSFRLAAIALLAAPCLLQAAAPVLEDPLGQESGANRVTPTIPFGKTLVLPIAGSDADGDLLEFRVASSHPRVFARVKTGNPILRVHVKYDGDPAANPPAAAFEGDLDFQMFRDLTPVTVGHIGGLAQAGYYDGLLFHRIIPGFVAQGGDKAGNGSGVDDKGTPGTSDDEFVGLSYNFEHEFQPSLIFTGRGQLAMANSNGGYSRGQHISNGFIRLGNFQATNGSQFFITFAKPRHLDFKHTIFGQLVRGFDILKKMEEVPKKPNGTVTTADDDEPTVAVKMVSTQVLPGRADATLMLSAISPIGIGIATVSVTATDPSGGRATRTFHVNVVEDTVNDPPIIRPIPNVITPVGQTPQVTLRGVDLEQDYLLFGIASASGNTQVGSFGNAQIATGIPTQATAGFRDFTLGVAGFNDPNLAAVGTAAAPFAPFDPYNWTVAEVAFGDRPVQATSQTVSGVVGVPLAGVILAEFRDADAAGRAADFTAVVNWGDGSAEQASAAQTPAVFIERSSARPGMYLVKASHTYPRPGVFRVKVVVDAALGATDTIYSAVTISPAGATLYASGRELTNVGATVRSRPIATFKDTTPGARPGHFIASIDWGDGVVSPGAIRARGDGEFVVTGVHTFREPGAYATSVQVRRTSPSAADTVAWSTITLSGFNAPRVAPPFSMPHLVGQLSLGSKPFKETTFANGTSRTVFTCSLVILNSGNEKSPPAELRFYLSPDETANASPLRNLTGAIVVPADTLVKIGTFPKGFIPALDPGAGLRYEFDVVNGQDLRLRPPDGETGSGLNLLAAFSYSDAVADHMPIKREVVFSPINGILVAPSVVQVTEAAGNDHAKSFTARLDRAPTHNVTIEYALSSETEVDIQGSSLVFTPTNWSVPQSVLLTAKDDILDDGTKTARVLFELSESEDPRWDGMQASEIGVNVADNDPVTP